MRETGGAAGLAFTGTLTVQGSAIPIPGAGGLLGAGLLWLLATVRRRHE